MTEQETAARPVAPPSAEELDAGLAALFEAHRRLRTDRRTMGARINDLADQLRALTDERDALLHQLAEARAERETTVGWFHGCAKAIRALLGKE